MTVELIVLMGACAYGAVQAFVTSRSEMLQQIHRNFSETFYLFGAGVLALQMLDGFGAWSFKGAIAYAAGRALYLLLSLKPTRGFRKWAWATSLAGIVGVWAELIHTAIALVSP